MTSPGRSFTGNGGFAWRKNIDDLASTAMLTFLNCDRITKLILTSMHRPKELCKIVSIAHIRRIVLIDTFSIPDKFGDRYTLIGLKCNDPEAQKLLRLHHINRSPHQGFAPGSSVNGFKSSVFEQFDAHTTENIIGGGLSEIYKIGNLDPTYLHWRPHAAFLPVNRVQGDIEFFAYLGDAGGFLAGLLLFLCTTAT